MAPGLAFPMLGLVPANALASAEASSGGLSATRTRPELVSLVVMNGSAWEACRNRLFLARCHSGAFQLRSQHNDGGQPEEVFGNAVGSRSLRLQSVATSKTQTESTSAPHVCADCVPAFESEVSSGSKSRTTDFTRTANVACSRIAWPRSGDWN